MELITLFVSKPPFTVNILLVTRFSLAPLLPSTVPSISADDEAVYYHEELIVYDARNVEAIKM